MASLGMLQAGCPWFLVVDDTGDDCMDCWTGGDADADGDGDGDGDAEIARSSETQEREAELADLDVLCHTAAVAFCDGDADCCAGGWTDEARASCIDGMLLMCDQLYSDAVLEGRLSVEVDPIGECFQSMREAVATHCPVGGPAEVSGSDACGRILVGRVAQGHYCTSPCECQSGLACLFDGPGDDLGVCDVAPGEGDGCTYVCERGLECLDGLCERPRGLGSICTVSADGMQDDCADGLYCTAEGVCAGRSSDGVACDTDRACFGGRCVDGLCATDAYDYCWVAEY